MTRKEIDAALAKLKTYTGADEETRRAFYKECRDWNYSDKELAQWWLWFCMGWKAAMHTVARR